MGWVSNKRLSLHGSKVVAGTLCCCDYAVRRTCLLATLTCHYFVFEALDIRVLAIRMIESCSEAFLIDLIGIAPLLQSPLAAALLAAVPLPPVAMAADRKNLGAHGASTSPLTKYDRQTFAAFLKAGLDNGQ